MRIEASERRSKYAFSIRYVEVTVREAMSEVYVIKMNKKQQKRLSLLTHLH